MDEQRDPRGDGRDEGDGDQGSVRSEQPAGPHGDVAEVVPPEVTVVQPVAPVVPAGVGTRDGEAPPVAGRRTVSRAVTAGIAGAALVVGLVAGGAGAAVVASGASTTTGTTAAEGDTSTAPSSGTDETLPYGRAPDQTVPDQTLPDRLPGFGGSRGFGGGGGASGTDQEPATAASAEQQVGVVTIDSTLGYQGSASAGTGMVLTSDGLVLTNNHVIEGATSVEVTVESTGRTYPATVLGADPTADIALLQLDGASGLQTVEVDDDGGVDAGDEVTAVGNAEGTGDLVAATGEVTATDQTMTASSGAGEGETLSGLIQFTAAVVSGDSGGPVLDDEGEVVGVTTAASSGRSTIVAYAIEIDDALAVVEQIESGVETGTVQIGAPAFLGVALSGQSGVGAVVGDVVDGTPAASAGLAAGDVVTAVDGTAIGSADDLSAALAAYEPGDRVQITWQSAATGTTEQATVTLVEGPAA